MERRRRKTAGQEGNKGGVRIQKIRGNQVSGRGRGRGGGGSGGGGVEMSQKAEFRNATAASVRAAAAAAAAAAPQHSTAQQVPDTLSTLTQSLTRGDSEERAGAAEPGVRGMHGCTDRGTEPDVRA